MVKYQLFAHVHTRFSSGTGEMLEIDLLVNTTSMPTKTVFTIEQSDTLTTHWFMCALHHRKVSGSIRQQVECSECIYCEDGTRLK